MFSGSRRQRFASQDGNAAPRAVSSDLERSNCEFEFASGAGYASSGGGCDDSIYGEARAGDYSSGLADSPGGGDFFFDRSGDQARHLLRRRRDRADDYQDVEASEHLYEDPAAAGEGRRAGHGWGSIFDLTGRVRDVSQEAGGPGRDGEEEERMIRAEIRCESVGATAVNKPPRQGRKLISSSNLYLALELAFVGFLLYLIFYF